MAGFPVSLFLTLTGVTLLFAIAETNGTLEALALAPSGWRAASRVVPVLLFLIACAVSSVGPGAVSTVALLAPLGMAMGGGWVYRAFLTALMIANGANAGNLSPFSAVGIIANGAMAKAGLDRRRGPGLVRQLRRPRRRRRRRVTSGWRRRRAGSAPRPEPAAGRAAAFSRMQLTTLAAIAAVDRRRRDLQAEPGVLGLRGGGAAAVRRRGSERAAVQSMPWGIIMMVCGVSVLIAVLEQTGGMDLFTSLLAAAPRRRR